MIEAIQKFLVKMQQQGHVYPLIHQAEVHVNLRCEQEVVQLVIKNGAVFILQNPMEQQSAYEISGSEAAMKQLIEGTSRLRVLEQKGEMKVNTSLRIALLLESLFYLTKAQEDFAKII
ncbi:hypothetical protein QFZ87_001378 [Bacillus sp. SLBN-46]|uniref:SCP2 sterol-binding domain-containing protein n=1 Tax=Bacillus sp. SLBN-46 TaxID=3042283 RepID=UPI00285F7AA9|nr:SCP2 sterol-binding domain-containing protein [Bacillus sp. SLBN-46]MDR6121781.1 hypothetical protein [Bacillus sp. SLBN-46]